MCSLVTYELFEMMEEFSDFKCPYSTHELYALKEAHEITREDDFLDKVYGNKSMLHHDDWCEAVVKNGSYIFD